MYGCQQVLLYPSKDAKAVLEFICEQANSLTNCAIYYARQMYFKKHKITNKYELQAEYKKNKHYKALYSQAGQQVLHSVAEAFDSFRKLKFAFSLGKILDKPSPPKYRKSGGLAGVSYPLQALKLQNSYIRVPLGRQVKSWFKIDSFFILMPSNLKYKNIKQLRILPKNGCFYAEFVYKIKSVAVHLNTNKALGIDPGLNNWLTCISNTGESFIVDGKHVKSLNRWYNKQISTLRKNKPKGFWSKKLACITEKRNRQMRDAVNKAARLVINYCVKNQIGKVVFGWNKGQKNKANLGSKTNQEFIQIPTAKLKERIKQLCEQYQIQFIETEESYTSKASFLDNDFLPTYDEKLKEQEYKFSGKRTKRGLYRTAQNWYINADANGAANILRKVSTTLSLDLSGVSRVSLTAPHRLKLWSAKKIKQYGVSLNHRVASL